jgi:hypothetical protein
MRKRLNSYVNNTTNNNKTNDHLSLQIILNERSPLSSNHTKRAITSLFKSYKTCDHLSLQIIQNVRSPLSSNPLTQKDHYICFCLINCYMCGVYRHCQLSSITDLLKTKAWAIIINDKGDSWSWGYTWMWLETLTFDKGRTKTVSVRMDIVVRDQRFGCLQNICNSLVIKCQLSPSDIIASVQKLVINQNLEYTYYISYRAIIVSFCIHIIHNKR